MKRLILVLCCIFMLLTMVSAADDATSVTCLTSKIVLAKDGSCTVTSDINVHFSGSDSSFRIPMGKDAKVVSFDRNYDTVTKKGIDYIVLKKSAGLSGDQTFHLTYKLPNQVSLVDGVQQLRLSILPGGYSCPIGKGSSFTIEFPKDLTAPPELYSGAHTDNAFSDFDIQISGNTYQATLLLPKMQEYDTLRLNADLPEDFFNLHNLSGTTRSFNTYLFLALLVLCVIYWFFRLRNGLIISKKRKILPLNLNAGELAYQITCDKPDLTAMVMQWANLGYLSLYRNKKGRIILYKRMEMGSERRELEQKVFNSLFRKDESCDGGSLRYRSLSKKVCQPFTGYWAHRLFDRHSGSVLILRVLGLLAGFVVSFMTFDLLFGSFAFRWVLIPLFAIPATYLSYLIEMGVVGLLRRRRAQAIVKALLSIVVLFILGKRADCSILMVLNILLQCFIGATTMFGGLRSRYGKDRLMQLLGFRRYLREASKSDLLRSLQNDGLYFYHTLPYAEVLGLGKKFSKLFGEIRMEPCAWLEDVGGVPVTAGEFYELYSEIAAKLRQEDNTLLSRLLNASKKKAPAGRYVRKPQQTASPARRPQQTSTPARRPQQTPTAQKAEPHVRPHRVEARTYSPEDDFDYV